MTPAELPNYFESSEGSGKGIAYCRFEVQNTIINYGIVNPMAISEDTDEAEARRVKKEWVGRLGESFSAFLST